MITLDDAKKINEEKLNILKGYKVLQIRENDEYYLFENGIPEEILFDNCANSYYISKKDGTIKNFYLPDEDNFKFLKESKEIYDYSKGSN